MLRLLTALKTRPFVANVGTFGLLYAGAEATQCLVGHGGPEDKGWMSVARVGAIGALALGPGLFFWYRALDRILPSRGPRAIITKTLVDQAFSSPCCIAVFFVGTAALEGRPDPFYELRNKFLSTYKLSCCFWLPVQVANFALVPSHARVAFVGTASFLWANALCFLKKRKLGNEWQICWQRLSGNRISSEKVATPEFQLRRWQHSLSVPMKLRQAVAKLQLTSPIN